MAGMVWQCDFGARLDFPKLCSYRPDSEQGSSATQPTMSTTAESAIGCPNHGARLDFPKLCSRRPDSERRSSATQPVTSTTAGSAISCPNNGMRLDFPKLCSYRPDSERHSSATQPTTSATAGSAKMIVLRSLFQAEINGLFDHFWGHFRGSSLLLFGT